MSTSIADLDAELRAAVEANAAFAVKSASSSPAAEVADMSMGRHNPITIRTFMASLRV